MQVRTAKSEQPEVGTHLARVVRLCDLGHQPGWEYMGEQNPSAYKLEITYELVNSKMKDGRPFFVSEEVKNTDSDMGTLAVRVQAAGISFDNITDMLDKPVMVTVKHNKKGRAQVAGKGGVSGVPAGMPVPELTNEAKFFDPYADDLDLDEYETFPEWKQNKFKEALDFNEMALCRRLAEEDNL